MAITLEDLKKVRPYQLKALQHIHDTCERHGIKYTLWAGTALGAVRHKGFIPWDTDVDVALLRPDFEKLKKILLKQNDEETGFYLELKENLKEVSGYYIDFHPKLKVDGTYFESERRKDFAIHHGVWIDIFPIDFEPSSKIKIFLLKKIEILKAIKRFKTSRYVHINFFQNSLQRSIKQFMGNSLRFVLKFIPGSFFYFLYDLFNSLTSKDGDYVISLATGYSYDKGRFEKEIFDGFEIVNFETHKFFVIKNYKLYFRKLYGDYMKIPDKNDPIRRNSWFNILTFKM